MVKEDKSTWKSNYFLKIIQLLDEYPKCFIVNADNVGSKQMQKIRAALRGKGVVLMGKNTMMRKAIRGHLENMPALEKLLPHIAGNVGLVFTKEDLKEVRDVLGENKVKTPAGVDAIAPCGVIEWCLTLPLDKNVAFANFKAFADDYLTVKAPARAGAIAPCNVVVPKQATALGPEKTSFFQALQITTKITKGCIEILNDVNLINIGDKVGASEATLLNMLNISPFSYGLIIQQVYDSGSVFKPEVLDIQDEDVRMRFMEGVKNIAAVSLAIGYPTACSAPHSIVNGFKRLLAIAVATEIEFEEAMMTKEFLKDPSKFASAAPVATQEAAPETKAEETKQEEEEEESDDDMGFGLFD